ncbi:FlaG family protein [Campylobacter hyointestinalis]|uniref:Flagellar biosynthesis protein FlaG n=1 Tax=Campylobacter hyointestinalis subsp. hyointestinalis TaxID=91352 RepID=A0A2S5J3B0_CAMHY|nr:FlaG family protein [Campylobacter hyointestinalis]ANE32099.1 flagellar protein FlaG [Campylobacter hyointestinalis subsp. hyointestinalis LMG 9260]KEA44394.1 flagellar protein FlaG [Campylobacter hyointestinalis subsp. hyointestinalis]MBT0612508.1 flagellar protein FlaG [Campylobacter hyointestinalis subsp. hyointestinalis]MDL2347293.1 FlaG family protein [Campylobacter hyointestinalis]MDL2349035.1 FlaG family protein [Campylobacter hyointestinalis]
MEIFKAASQQIDNSIALNNRQGSVHTRSVEQTKINENLVRDNANQNEQNQESTTQKLNEAISKLNENMEKLQTNVRFAYNDKISAMYVNVTEVGSGKVIRKIPSEEVMNLTEHFREIVGMLFDKKE